MFEGVKRMNKLRGIQLELKQQSHLAGIFVQKHLDKFHKTSEQSQLQ
jgi:hypothetical protein